MSILIESKNPPTNTASEAHIVARKVAKSNTTGGKAGLLTYLLQLPILANRIRQR